MLKREFIQLSKAWYAKASLPSDEVDEIQLSVGSDEDFVGEFDIVWYAPGLDGPCPSSRSDAPYSRLEAYEDSWTALRAFEDVFAALGRIPVGSSPDEVAGLLRSLGVEDATPHVRPASLFDVAPSDG